MVNLTAQEGAELRKQVKDRKRATVKGSIAKSEPLKHAAPPARLASASAAVYVRRWRQGEAAPTPEATLREVEKQIQAASHLPRSSRYAQHRLKVLHKAQELLQAGYVYSVLSPHRLPAPCQAASSSP